MKRATMAAILLAGCLPDPTSGPTTVGGAGGAPTCWTIVPVKTCKDCGSYKGVSCTACETKKVCQPCKDAANGGGRDSGTIAKCVTLCP